MNKEDRMKAFSMRCDGATWSQVALVLGYDDSTIAKDLHGVLEKPPHVPAIKYPALKAYVQEHCHGSIEVFAAQLQVSPHRLRRVLVHGDRPSAHLIEKITTYTGINRKEAFSNAVYLQKLPSGVQPANDD